MLTPKIKAGLINYDSERLKTIIAHIYGLSVNQEASELFSASVHDNHKIMGKLLHLKRNLFGLNNK